MFKLNDEMVPPSEGNIGYLLGAINSRWLGYRGVTNSRPLSALLKIGIPNTRGSEIRE